VSFTVRDVRVGVLNVTGKDLRRVLKCLEKDGVELTGSDH
jgi:hypothetical protein